MAIRFGRLGSDGTTFEEQVFHKNQTVESGSVGAHHHFMYKDNPEPGVDGVVDVLSIEGVHWAYIHNLFYRSGSSKNNLDEIEKFNNIYHSFNKHNDLTPYYNHKFYDSGSVFYIPQATFGERIKPGSFQLTARTGSASNTTDEIIIKDDSNGNLYSSNAHHSQSAGSLSSKDNYVGNIWYDLGVLAVTETGSWSGSVNYTDIGRFNPRVGKSDTGYRFWECKFNSTITFFTSQFSINIPAGEFNRTMNETVKPSISGSVSSDTDVSTIANMRSELTGSEFSPYFNQIHLHRNQQEEPIIIANLPRAVQMRDDVDIIITFRIDH